MAKPPRLIGIGRSLGCEDRWPAPIGQPHGARDAAHEIRVGVRTGGSLFARDVEDAVEGAFQRGVPGLHRMLKAHPRPITVEVGLVEAARIVQAGGIAEMAGRREIVFDIEPARIRHGRCSPVASTRAANAGFVVA